ncbi:Mbeg1-like protein [Conchiformibius kuhniae]|uniref:Mbeg1-like protein n=1 Tax=Conchiformibius kuhniae TaxID=211502 RepID=UPI0003FC638C|nr:Mbeg1-like protein [Conchiformibius kuhniae]UOP04975.1 DUF2974 domain-containing protein [Conchiformibius kuhniae]
MLLPLEYAPTEAEAATPDTAPASADEMLPPPASGNASYMPAYGHTASHTPPPAPVSAKSAAMSATPFWVAGSALALGGFGIAVKGSGSKNDNDNDKRGDAPASANGGGDTAAPEPVANHVRVVYGHQHQQHIKPVDKWQDGLTHQGKKLTTADVSEAEILAKYTAKHGAEKIQTNIRQAYQLDSDGDGIIDRYDSNPDAWNVSDRDLRMFSTLAYKDENTLNKAFSGNRETIDKINKGSKDYIGQADLNELLTHWTVVKQGSPGNGLSYTVFGNGKQADGSYENMVVAFRGTEKFSPKDWINDLQLMNGTVPDQARHLQNIADEVMAYKPANVYSTGHSLGGYLAQFFAVNAMAQSEAHKQAFKHSALFNTAVLKTDEDSPEVLHQARAEAEKFASTLQPDHSDLSESPKNSYKTNSYVITGEWVSAGFHGLASDIIKGGSTISGAVAGAQAGAAIGGPFGALLGFLFGGLVGKKAGDTIHFDGLGSYDNSIFFNFKKDEEYGKHDLSSFYERDAKLQKYFSTGYRTDAHYAREDLDGDGLDYVQEKRIGLRPDQHNGHSDDDNDGFSDVLEIKLGSNFRDANQKIDLKEYYAVKAEEKLQFAVAGKETEDGTLLQAFGVELSANIQDNQLVYTPSGTAPVVLGMSNAEWAHWLEHSKIVNTGTAGDDRLSGLQDKAAVLYGGAGDDVLSASTGLDVMVGGAGNDTFRFFADALNRDKSPDLISDFSAGDRLDLSGMRALFADHARDFKFSDILFDSKSPLFDKHSALVWQQETQTLSYKTAHSDELHAIVRFDDSQTLASVQAGLLA